MAKRWGNNGNSDRLFPWAPKSLQMMTAAMKLKRRLLLGRKNYDKPRQHMKKQRYHLANKGLYSQNYGFSSSHVRCESWPVKKVPKNWCFRTVVLEKTLESPLDWKKRSNQSILKEINPEYSFKELMLKLQHFGHLMKRASLLEKTPMLGKTKGRRRRGWQRMRWLDSNTDSMDMSLSKLREMVKKKPGVL